MVRQHSDRCLRVELSEHATHRNAVRATCGKGIEADFQRRVHVLWLRQSISPTAERSSHAAPNPAEPIARPRRIRGHPAPSPRRSTPKNRRCRSSARAIRSSLKCAARISTSVCVEVLLRDGVAAPTGADEHDERDVGQLSQRFGDNPTGLAASAGANLRGDDCRGACGACRYRAIRSTARAEKLAVAHRLWIARPRLS